MRGLAPPSTPSRAGRRGMAARPPFQPRLGHFDVCFASLASSNIFSCFFLSRFSSLHAVPPPPPLWPSSPFIYSYFKARNSTCPLARDKWIFRRTTRLLIFVVRRTTWITAPSIVRFWSYFNGISLLRSRQA